MWVAVVPVWTDCVVSVFTDSWKPDSFMGRSWRTERLGCTLLLLDIKVKEQSIENMARGRLIYEPPRYMDIATAAQQLLEIESIRQEQAYTPNTPCVAISRLGSPTQTFKAGTLQELSEYDSGEPLHSLVMLGRQVHELELEYLYQFVDDKEKFKKFVEQDQEFSNQLRMFHRRMWIVNRGGVMGVHKAIKKASIYSKSFICLLSKLYGCNY